MGRKGVPSSGDLCLEGRAIVTDLQELLSATISAFEELCCASIETVMKCHIALAIAAPDAMPRPIHQAVL